MLLTGFDCTTKIKKLLNLRYSMSDPQRNTPILLILMQTDMYATLLQLICQLAANTPLIFSES